jgi:hypothetical protein
MSATNIKKTDQSATYSANSANIPCCPDLLNDDHCDVFNFKRILNYPVSVNLQGRQVQYDTEVILHFSFKRCTLGLTLGDPIYSTTLLPGEKVRLATTDRKSRFSFDSESKLSYRSEQISEEQYYMTALQHYVTDGANKQSGSGSSSNSGDWDFHGDAHGSYGSYVFGGSADASVNSNGSHNSKSVFDYLHEQSSHAEASANQSVNATQKAHSLSVGEVSSRTHVEGESEDHFESASRVFSNPNHCHAVTFLFYRLNKKQKISFTIEKIERRVKDPVAPVRRPFTAAPVKAAVSVVPQDVAATSKAFSNRQQLLAHTDTAIAANTGAFNFQPVFTTGTLVGAQPIPVETHQLVLKELDIQLQKQNLITNNGTVSTEIKNSISFDISFSLPTGGVIVKGCLDECNVCEPLVKERLQLENDLLRKQIELLEKSQQYRCCPPAPIVAGSTNG